MKKKERKDILKKLKRARNRVGERKTSYPMYSIFGNYQIDTTVRIIYTGLCDSGIPANILKDIKKKFKPKNSGMYWWPKTKEGTRIRKAIIDIYIKKYSK